MSWFQSTNLASFAKTALKEAQKTIDKALDINESESDGSLSSSTTSEKVAAVTGKIFTIINIIRAGPGILLASGALLSFQTCINIYFLFNRSCI
jgi:hypothetical protein